MTPNTKRIVERIMIAAIVESSILISALRMGSLFRQWQGYFDSTHFVTRTSTLWLWIRLWTFVLNAVDERWFIVDKDSFVLGALLESIGRRLQPEVLTQLVSNWNFYGNSITRRDDLNETWNYCLIENEVRERQRKIDLEQQLQCCFSNAVR